MANFRSRPDIAVTPSPSLIHPQHPHDCRQRNQMSTCLSALNICSKGTVGISTDALAQHPTFIFFTTLAGTFPDEIKQLEKTICGRDFDWLPSDRYSSAAAQLHIQHDHASTTRRFWGCNSSRASRLCAGINNSSTVPRTAISRSKCTSNR